MLKFEEKTADFQGNLYGKNTEYGRNGQFPDRRVMVKLTRNPEGFNLKYFFWKTHLIVTFTQI